MAKQTVKENIVTVTCMSVAGGDLDLPKGHKYFVNLELDYEGIELAEAIQLASEGSSVRVKAQAKLRALGDKALEEGGAVVAESANDVQPMELGTFTFKVATDFESEKGGPRDPEKTAKSAFSKMSREQKVQFIIDTMGIEPEVAETMVPQIEE